MRVKLWYSVDSGWPVLFHPRLMGYDLDFPFPEIFHSLPSPPPPLFFFFIWEIIIAVRDACWGPLREVVGPERASAAVITDGMQVPLLAIWAILCHTAHLFFIFLLYLIFQICQVKVQIHWSFFSPVLSLRDKIGNVFCHKPDDLNNARLHSLTHRHAKGLEGVTTIQLIQNQNR